MTVVGCPSLKFSLRNLCVLCASAVNMSKDKMNRRGAEDAETTQRQIAWLCLKSQNRHLDRVSTRSKDSFRVLRQSGIALRNISS